MKFNILSLSVWGNKKDGYEVNDTFSIGETIDINEDDTDKIIRKKFAKVMGIKSITRFTVESHERDIFVNCSKTGKPAYHLRAE